MMTTDNTPVNETHRHTSQHVHRRPRTGRTSRSRRHERSILEPVWYFTGTVLFVLLALLLHVPILPAAFGAAGILALALSKPWKFRTGVILSVALVLTSVMIFNWRFIDEHGPAAMAGELAAKPGVASAALLEMFVPILLVGIFNRQINSIHIRSSQKWFVKKSYVRFLTLLFFFQLALFHFLIFDTLLLNKSSIFRISPQDAAMVAALAAVLISGIPSILYIVRGAPRNTRHHRHHHRHHHQTGAVETPSENPSEAEK